MTTTGEAMIHPRRGDDDADADDDDDIATSTSSSSSEAAGVARGAARTASAISRRQLVGRLPKSASKSTATGATATASRSSSMMKTMRTSSSSSGPGRGVGVLPKKVPVKHVAKVSDRISTGFDAYDAAISSSSSSPGTTSTGSTSANGANTSTATTSSTTSNNVTAGGNATNNNVTTHNNINNNNAATGTSNDGGTSGSSKKKIIMDITDGIPVEKWKSHVTNLLSFAKTMVKNTLLGTAVFGMYEETILYLDRYNRQTENNVMMGVSSSSSSSSNGATSTNTATTTDDDDTTTSSTTDAYKRTMVSQHFVAGLAAGSVHSILYMSFESMEYLRQHYHPWWRSPFRPLNMNMMNSYNCMSNNSMSNHNLFPNVRSLSSWSFCHIFHHAIAHALLFSTYEGTRRLLLFGNGNNYENDANVNNYKVSSNNNIINNNNNDENTLQHAFIIGLAGGFAGQMQHVVSHYTEILLRVGENDSPWTHSGRQKLSDFVFVIHDWKFWRINGPSRRSVLMAFPPSAIGFVAFEYGKLLME